jgi:integrase
LPHDRRRPILEDARDRALECRRLRDRGIDPINARREAKQQAALEKTKGLKFKDASETYIEAHRFGWTNARHKAQWSRSLSAYAYPIIGDLSVDAIDTGIVLKVLEPIWASKTETASRLRGRIESILDWAKVRKYRNGENPARWRGHLDKLLPSRSKVRRVEHHTAMPFAVLPAFMVELRQQDTIAGRALEFLILTAARTGEVIGAQWSEVDLENKIWIIAPERMKARREHRVPLPARAVDILKALPRSGTYVFFGKDGQPGLCLYL